jgi:hypothetical protein
LLAGNHIIRFTRFERSTARAEGKVAASDQSGRAFPQQIRPKKGEDCLSSERLAARASSAAPGGFAEEAAGRDRHLVIGSRSYGVTSQSLKPKGSAPSPPERYRSPRFAQPPAPPSSQWPPGNCPACPRYPPTGCCTPCSSHQLSAHGKYPSSA